MSERRFQAGLTELSIQRFEPSGERKPLDDRLVVEEPLEIRLDSEPWLTTMRTPGYDEELALGLLFAEGLVDSRADVLSVRPCPKQKENSADTLDVSWAQPGVDERKPRATLMSSSCGVCGRVQIDDLLQRYGPVKQDARFSAADIFGMTGKLRQAQRNFEHTGGIHAAAVVNPAGSFQVVREDIGRHNAVDKSFGRLLLDDALPPTASALLVSGRCSFEITQKAWRAGIEVVVSISAASSLAVEMAERAGMTLIGFARESGFNLYTGGERII